MKTILKYRVRTIMFFLAKVRTIMLIVKSRAYIKIKFIPVEFKQSMKHL